MTKKNLKFYVPAALAALALAAFTGCCENCQNETCNAPASAEKKVRALLKLNEQADAYVVSGSDFSAKFSKTTGTLESLVYRGKPMIVEGKGPKLNAFRAIINNDGWAFGKWFQNGLFDLKHEVLGKPAVAKNANGTVTLSFVVRSQGKNAGTLVGDPLIQYGSATNGIPVKINLGRELGENDFAFTTHQIWTVYPDGSVEIAANITSNNPEFDLPRLGYTMNVPAEYSDFVYYGRGPQENYADRKSGAFIGVHESSVKDQYENYTKPQEMGNHEDVRWCALTNPDSAAPGLLFISSGDGFSAQALPVSAKDLLFASNPHKLKGKIANSKETTLNIDVGVRGLGGASCGPDTEKRDKVFAAPTTFGFMIRPTANEPADMVAAANVSPAGAVPLSVVRNVAGAVSVSSQKQNAEIFVSVNGAPAQKYTDSIPFKNGGTIVAWFAESPEIKTEMTFPKIDKVRLSVVYASSENSGNEAASMLTDNDPATIWHTAYSVTQADYPHEIDFDIGESKKIKGFTYLPRQDGPNGDVKGYEILVSQDGKTWSAPVAKGEFENTKAEKRILFSAPTDARYVRFRALSSQNGAIYGSGAEFSVLEN